MAKLSSLRGNADIKCNPSTYDMNYEGHYVFVSLLLLPPPRLTTFSATASVRGRRPRILVATARASLSLSLSLSMGKNEGAFTNRYEYTCCLPNEKKIN